MLRVGLTVSGWAHASGRSHDHEYDKYERYDDPAGREDRRDHWQRKRSIAAHGAFDIEPPEKGSSPNDQCEEQEENRDGLADFGHKDVGGERFDSNSACQHR